VTALLDHALTLAARAFGIAVITLAFWTALALA
jgi:hypothetical protein